MDKLSYGLGLGIGQQLAQMNIEGLNIEDFAAAIKDVLAGNKLQVDHREAQQIVQDYFQKQEEKLNKEREEKGRAAKEEGEKYLAENAKKDGVITTASGLQYKVLKEGTGKAPKATDTVKCHYEGFLIDGTVFDSSVQRGEPAVFGLQQVIAMDRRFAVDERGRQDPLLHSLSAGLWCQRCRCKHPSLRSPHLRCGTD